MTTITPRYSTTEFRVECEELWLTLKVRIPGTELETTPVSVDWPKWVFDLDEEIKNYEPLISEMVELLLEKFDEMDLTVTRTPGTFREFRSAVKNAIEPGGGHVPTSFRAYRRLGDFREVHLTPRSTVTAHPGTMVVTIDDDISREGSREDQVPSIRVAIPGESVFLTWGEARMLRDSLDEILGVVING